MLYSIYVPTQRLYCWNIFICTNSKQWKSKNTQPLPVCKGMSWTAHCLKNNPYLWLKKIWACHSWSICNGVCLASVPCRYGIYVHKSQAYTVASAHYWQTQFLCKRRKNFETMLSTFLGQCRIFMNTCSESCETIFFQIIRHRL